MTADAPEVLVEAVDGVGRLTLNRPKAINALSRAMIDLIAEALDAWEHDDAVRRVELRGAGERGFCAGADVRALREQVLTEPEQAIDFFRAEYVVNGRLASYPKPVLAVCDGITMGGGLGLALHNTQREGTPSSTLAMPEVTIGLFPDVGVMFELSRMPGETGTFMAMTGQSVDVASASWAGLLTETDELTTHPDDSWLASNRHWIDECFVGDDPVAIVDALEHHAVAEAREAAGVIRSKCPLSVAVALEGLRRAAAMSSVAEVLQQDMVLATHFVRDSDFVEGVRAQLVDKDRQPKWRHARLEDVSRDEVEAMFDPAGIERLPFG